MARTDKLSTYRTAWEHDATRGSVTYISTRIVARDGDAVTLNSDGWQTVTTKRKMCQAANQFGLRFCVYQKAGEWFVDVRNPRDVFEATGNYWQGLKIPFRDGMTFDMYTGELL
jgi:isocitrate dehydrogenase kinase/phosphatase